MSDNVTVDNGANTDYSTSTKELTGGHHVIGVELVSAVSAGARTDLAKAEDSAHSSGDMGIMALAVRKDTAAALAGADGDYLPLIVDSTGRLHVYSDGGRTSTVTSSSSVTAGATSVQVAAANTNRRRIIIVNDSDTVVYLKYGTTAELNKGVRLNPAGGSIVEDFYTGRIDAISSAASKVLTVTEVG